MKPEQKADIISTILNRAFALLQGEKFRGIIEKFIRRNYSRGVTLEEAKLKLNFNIIPQEERIKFLTDYTQTSVNKVMDELNTDLRQTVREGIMNNEPPNMIKQRVKLLMNPTDKLEHEFASGRKMNWRNRIDMITRTESNRAQNQGHMDAFKQSRLSGEKWISVHRDDRLCAICSKAGKQYDKDNAIPINEEFIVTVAKKTYRFQAPPIHPRCFDKHTEVLTNEGWRLFKDLEGNNTICSLNPETNEIEYLAPSNYVQYHHKGKMWEYKGKTVSLCVTADHNNPVTKKYKTDKDGERDDTLQFKETKDLRYEERIPITGEWKGQETKEIQIGEKKIPMLVFCRFMAIWLSDGYTVSTRPTVVGIANQRKQEIIREALVDFPYKLNFSKEKVSIYDRDLHSYLSQFGKSVDKFIPLEIKNLSPTYLKEFLIYYFDSHERKEHASFGGKYTTQPTQSYFTTSPQLASDLGEIILKAGDSPSYYLQKMAGREIEFKNGRYTINSDLWIIARNKSKFRVLSKRKFELIDYDDFVYDVELPKYHILYVRRNGRCQWSGNCRCRIMFKITEGENDNV